MIPLVEFSFDRDDFMDRDDRGLFDRPDTRQDEPDMRDEMRRERDLEEQVRQDDLRRMDDAARARLEAAAKRLTVDDLREMVNNSNIRVTSRGRISSRRPSGRDVIRRSGQFTMQGFDLPTKKPRKKNKKHCSNLSSCLRQANAELRTKKGKLRKGKTQADIMRRAQRLLRKMK